MRVKGWESAADCLYSRTKIIIDKNNYITILRQKINGQPCYEFIHWLDEEIVSGDTLWWYDEEDFKVELSIYLKDKFDVIADTDKLQKIF